MRAKRVDPHRSGGSWHQKDYTDDGIDSLAEPDFEDRRSVDEPMAANLDCSAPAGADPADTNT